MALSHQTTETQPVTPKVVAVCKFFDILPLPTETERILMNGFVGGNPVSGTRFE